VNSGKTAEPIELPFARDSECDWPEDGPTVVPPADRHAHWRHLANTVKRLFTVAVSGPTTGGNAARSQITFGNNVKILFSILFLLTANVTSNSIIIIRRVYSF